MTIIMASKFSSNTLKPLFMKLVERVDVITKVNKLSLLQEKAYIDGQWISAKSGKTFQVVNPSNGEIFANVPNMDKRDVRDAIHAAYTAFPSWSNTSARVKASSIKKWFHLLEKHKDDLADVIVTETGKPMDEARKEVAYGNSYIEWFAEEARRIRGEILPNPVENREFLVVKKPIGVVAIITPWNFPYAMIARKTGAALAAGCTCVIKPASDTPCTALALCSLADKAGLPKGLLNIITTDNANAPLVGKELCESTQIAGLSFTGSTEVGKLLYTQCAGSIKRVGLELGGNAPFILFESGDIESAVDGAMASKFRNTGQACTSANRLLIQKNVFSQFVDKLKIKMNGLKMGDGFEEGVNQGPLISKNHFEKIDRIVKDAVSKGAKVETGGRPAEEIGELFYQPTLLTNISPNMMCYTEEIFGPIAACIKFETEDEALQISNSTNLGLSGYFYSGDISQIWRVANKLEVGMVGVNIGLISAAEAPFGGIKESGIGREGSHHGIDEFVYIKYICLGDLHN